MVFRRSCGRVLLCLAALLLAAVRGEGGIYNEGDTNIVSLATLDDYDRIV